MQNITHDQKMTQLGNLKTRQNFKNFHLARTTTDDFIDQIIACKNLTVEQALKLIDNFEKSRGANHGLS